MTLNSLDTKDPDETKDYSVNWYRELVKYGDTISTSAWPSPPAGISIVTNTHNTTSTTVWLSGGALGTDYVLTNRIVTVGGRTLDQSIIIRVRER